jgi:hypothetical protein
MLKRLSFSLDNSYSITKNVFFSYNKMQDKFFIIIIIIILF